MTDVNALVFVMQRPAQYLCGDVDLVLEQHRERRMRRSSQTMTSNGSDGGGSSSGGGVAAPPPPQQQLPGRVSPDLLCAAAGRGQCPSHSSPHKDMNQPSSAGAADYKVCGSRVCGPGFFTSADPSSTAAGHSSSTGVRQQARAAQRRAEENRIRESELLNARKAYFEERKHAAARQRAVFKPTGDAPPQPHPPPASGLPQSQSQSQPLPGSSLYQQHSGSGRLLQQQGPRQEQRPAGAWVGGAASGYSQRGGTTWCGSGEVATHPTDSSGSSDDASELIGSGPAACRAAAAQEFEEELSGGEDLPFAGEGGVSRSEMSRTFDSGAGASARAGGLRDLCSANLGPQLFEVLYGLMRQRSLASPSAADGALPLGAAATAGSDTDAAFKSKLVSRLGHSRMQYVHCIDQLIYFEDMMQGLP
ncbi:MAG: hypothetical protein WDW36_007492 [Sanguina aurantia]